MFWRVSQFKPTTIDHGSYKERCIVDLSMMVPFLVLDSDGCKKKKIEPHTKQKATAYAAHQTTIVRPRNKTDE